MESDDERRRPEINAYNRTAIGDALRDAAPELLAALKEMTSVVGEVFSSTDDVPATLERARALIERLGG